MRRYRSVALIVIFLSLFSLTTAFDEQSGLSQIAETLVKEGVGNIVQIKDYGSPVPLVIFQDIHTSIMVNVETAIMLNRLYENYQANRIGLEGAVDRLNASWYHTLPGDNHVAVAAQHLAEGEISSAEFMALVEPQVIVEGIEDAQQYDQNIADRKAVGAAVPVLVALSKLNMTPEEQNRATQIAQEQGGADYLNYCLSFDSWASERYQSLYMSMTTPPAELVGILDDIIARGKQMGLDSASLQSLQEERDFYQGVEDRSRTMVEKMLSIAGSDSTITMSMVVGMAHIARIMELLDEQQHSYIVIQPASLEAALYDTRMPGMMPPLATDNQWNGLSVDSDNGFGAMVGNYDAGGQIKPPPVIGKVFYKRKSLSYSAFDLISQQLRNTVDIDDLKNTLQSTFESLKAKGLEINPNSITRLGDTQTPSVKFEATLAEVIEGNVKYPAISFQATVMFNPQGDALRTHEGLLKQSHQAIEAAQATQVLSNTASEAPTVFQVTLDTSATVTFLPP